MNTLVWRLHRGQAYVAGTALIVLTAVLLITGIALSRTYHGFVTGCAAAHDCGDTGQVLGGYGLITNLVFATMAIPVLFGLFWARRCWARSSRTAPTAWPGRRGSPAAAG
jgi:hypothetical protein